MSQKDFHDFCVIYTNSICCWNRIESLFRSLLQGPRPNPSAFIAALHLDPEALALAVKATAEAYADSQRAKHVLHAAEYFDRLRLHRNHYVHRLAVVAMDASNEFALKASVYSLSARGRVRLIEQPVSLDDVKEFFGWCCALEVYVNALTNRPTEALDALALAPFPEMPILPSKGPREAKRYLFGEGRSGVAVV
ncbi:MAG: hypothetical protein ACK5SX_08745 [Sandaracinobacter sp.]